MKTKPFYFLILLFFSSSVFSQKKDLKAEFIIKRESYDILIIKSPTQAFIKRKIRLERILEKIFQDTSSKIKLGKADDLNFIKKNMDSLLVSKSLKDNIVIEEIDKKYGFINSVTISSKNKRNLKKYFIFRRYL